jgi:hypothetical protein
MKPARFKVNLHVLGRELINLMVSARNIGRHAVRNGVTETATVITIWKML